MKTQNVAQVAGHEPAQETGLRQKGQLLSASEVDRTLVRLAYQVVEDNGVEGWA